MTTRQCKFCLRDMKQRVYEPKFFTDVESEEYTCLNCGVIYWYIGGVIHDTRQIIFEKDEKSS
jgi:uncharacterized protein with PIN domain